VTRPITPNDHMNAAIARLGLPTVATHLDTIVRNARTLVDIPSVGPELWQALGALRGSVQALDESYQLAATIATSEQIVREHVEVFDLPGRTPRESAALTEHEAGVDAFVSRPEFGGAK
jgi:hypothetical protein